MPRPRPSLVLILDIDERLDSEEVRQEIRRSYAYIGSTIIRTHTAPEESEISNTASILVKLGTRNYLFASDEESDDLWNEIMKRWFYNQFHKIGNNMRIYNRREREIGGTELYFDTLDIDLQNGTLHAIMRLDSTSGIDPEQSEQLDVLRKALNEGLLGENVKTVIMPSASSFEQQQAAEIATRAERAEALRQQEEAEAQAEAAKRAQLEAEAEENFLESPALSAAAEESGEQARAGADADDAADTEAADDEAAAAAAEQYEDEHRFDLPDPDFVIDYRIWSVEYADGTVRDFDSSAGSFLDEEVSA